MTNFPSLDAVRKYPGLYQAFSELWRAMTTFRTAFRLGTVTLEGLATRVDCPVISISSRVFLTPRLFAGTPGSLSCPVNNRVPGVSFEIVSTNAADRSEIEWLLINL